MIKLFVSIPPKYQMTKEEIDKFTARYEEIAHEVECRLEKYCELYYTLDGLVCSDIEAGRKGYMFDQFSDLKDADCAVFADGWKSSEECVRLHKIVELLGIRILDFDDKDGETS